MKQPSITQLAERLGTSRSTIYRARATGIDLSDVKALKSYLATRGKRVTAAAKISETDPAAQAQTIEEIRTALARAKDYKPVKILSEKLRGLLAIERLQSDLRTMIRAEDAAQMHRRILCAAQAGIKQLASRVAPIAAGNPAASIHKILMEAGHEILAALADPKSDFWTEADRRFPITDPRLR